MQFDDAVMQTLLASMQEGVCITDSTDIIIQWNAALALRSGICEANAVGRPFSAFAEAVVWSRHSSVSQDGISLHFGPTEDTKLYRNESAFAPTSGDNIGVSWQIFAHFLERLPYIFFVLDDDVFLFANERARTFWGKDGKSIIGRTVTEVVHSLNNTGELLERNREIVRTGKPTVREEMVAFNHLGEQHTLEVNKFPARIEDPSGRTRELLTCIAVDLSDLRSAQRALIREKEQLSATLNGIDDGIAAVDARGTVVFMNAVAERLAGASAKESIGRPLAEVFLLRRERDRRPVPDIGSFLCSGSLREERHNLILEMRNGDVLLMSQTLSAVVDEKEQVSGAVVVFRDVTEKRRTEEELRKAQKLESVATMAGGIAHDFNNILTAILGSITLVRMADSLDRDFYDTLTDAERAVKEAKALTQQLLVFAEGQVPIREDTPLDELVRDATEFALRGANVRASFEISNALNTVRIDKSQIAQVIQNTVMNARDSMPDGGTIIVRVFNIERTVPDRPGPPRDFIAITITDHGSGIARQHMPRIFDPYFTTKTKSAGLGLSVCYSIVRNHDGFIEVSSEFGVGSQFSVYLPASAPTGLRGTPRNRVKPALFNKRILVMDDEQIVRNVLAKMFARLGCRCSFAENGNEALFLYSRALESGLPFDLVILDLTVPGGMGGKETVARLRESDPDVVAVLSSGYLNDPVMAQYTQYGFRATITKPYSLADLTTVLSTVFKKG